MPNPPSVKGAEPPGLVAKAFPAKAAEAAVKDWYRFVLEELNGLGTMWRYDRQEGGRGADNISARTRAMLETLAWDPQTAVTQAWAFVANDVHQPEDAWGPYLLLVHLKTADLRLRAWVHTLPRPTRALLVDSPVQKET